jgi:hypothetical protein
MMRYPTRAEAADELRGQAESCRRLALRAPTMSGSAALRSAAHQFDADAARMSLIAIDATAAGDAAALVRVRLALECQTARWLRPQSGG